ncbi:superoxide dismutase [Pedobacter caeni]|uniref:Superoxide dismutase n=1 Tax=Pedobacter caeni TaxID=288992 RepID=A0A1M5L7S6_9SPHI|nr:superoxide dismutase [Pedobacter caeni]SHG61016.1 superoxide dismutase, Fe-Mn family [Pedobacter caeni]
MDITLQLPELPYQKDSMAPIITEETFDYHYGKHHATYVNNLKNLTKDDPLSETTVEQILLESHHNNNTLLFNNAAQHWNHSFFWHCLSPNGGGLPQNDIKQLIDRDFGDFDTFRNQFSTTALKLFGAGWTWLAQNEAGKLEIIPLKDASTPLTENKTPILTLDVWEHAYYIDYRNERNKFIDGFWEVVNWDFANKNLLCNI